MWQIGKSNFTIKSMLIQFYDLMHSNYSLFFLHMKQWMQTFTNDQSMVMIILQKKI
jgi:hypothetical protein